ncbi:Deoxyribonuclease II family protein [Aphelenchoides avenae]|nr:Deoxyribonuclease II family protein [Aphelenchus avenae]
MSMWFIFAIVLWLSVVSSQGASPACKDPSGNDVDWFVGLKLPKSAGPSGYEYYYADAKNPKFKLETNTLKSDKGAVGRTAQIAIDSKKDQSRFTLFYNDEHPDEELDGYRAHMKGFIAFDEKQGFWLIHSVPGLVDSNKPYEYPESGTKYGQSILCVTYPTKALEEIAEQLIVGQPSIYDFVLPEFVKSAYPRMQAAAEGKKQSPKGREVQREAKLTSKGGEKFLSFQKNRLFAKDLYADFVASSIGKDMYVETWLNGAAKDYLPLCDGPGKVTSLRSVKPGAHNWASSMDHSKWVVTKDPSWVCIGDVNRQESQAKRGGGTVCFENKQIWKFMRDAVDTYECCSDETGSQCTASPANSAPTGGR